MINPPYKNFIFLSDEFAYQINLVLAKSFLKWSNYADRLTVSSFRTMLLASAVDKVYNTRAIFASTCQIGRLRIKCSHNRIYHKVKFIYFNNQGWGDTQNIIVGFFTQNTRMH